MPDAILPRAPGRYFSQRSALPVDVEQLHFLVTRPQQDAAVTAKRIRDLGHKADIAPVLEIRTRTLDLKMQTIGGFALTSVNGVRALAAMSEPCVFSRHIFAVGERTATAARAAGFLNVSVPAEPSGVDALCAHITAYGDATTGRIVHVSGRDSAGDIVSSLGKAGFEAERVVAYDAVAVDDFPQGIAKMIEAGSIDAVLLYSARSARVFLELARRRIAAPALAGLRFLCLSQAVASMMEDLQQYGRVNVADTPDENAMMALIARVSSAEN